MWQRAERIRQLNDRMRRTLTAEHVQFTDVIKSLDEPALEKILDTVRRFDAFDPHIDLDGEHEFGMLSIDGHVIMFRITYQASGWSSPPPDPAADDTIRVLTIMDQADYWSGTE